MPAPKQTKINGVRAVACLEFIHAPDYEQVPQHRWYVFNPSELNQLTRAEIACTPPTQVKIDIDSSEWVFHNAGGAIGALYIIYASITEYLFIFGTPLRTEGHTGFLLADDYFTILVGEQWALFPGQLEMKWYTAGMVHYLPRGTAKQYKMHKGCFALEYVRGWIPLMLPFGLVDAITSSLDFVTV
ncbi:ERG2 and Sigma1 receptor like protein-domain-containing protein [Mycena epipterygia]|nr:ERG2 and Sigma1 receptor like protein-domain-containing protein [Mycena epipterygia]